MIISFHLEILYFEKQNLWTVKKVYLGNLGSHPPSTAEVEKEMGYYGKLVSVWIARRPPGFGYVEFEDPRDAKDAIRDLDGRYLLTTNNGWYLNIF